MSDQAPVLFIKNMVCQRCTMAVEKVLQDHAIPYHEVSLGIVSLSDKVEDSKLKLFFADLEKLGFEQILSADKRLVESMRNLIIQEIRQPEASLSKTWSVIMSEAFHRDYSGLSKLFSSVEGMTLEHYIVLQKIERAKELLLYDEHNVSEIADLLGYSSGQIFATQFKNHTGFTPTAFRKQHPRLRRGLDEV
jgi:AraC-like DNA-binding protein